MGQSKPILSEAIEDYLKEILRLEEDVRPTPGQRQGLVANKALAERMAVRPASVTKMLRRLSELGLLEYVPYAGVRLTDRGRKVALEVSRHHRLLETYLHRALGYSWEEVHAEAERLEHAISEDLEARIAAQMYLPAIRYACRITGSGTPCSARRRRADGCPRPSWSSATASGRTATG